MGMKKYIGVFLFLLISNISFADAEKLFMKTGDTYPSYKIQLYDSNGAIDLTGATVSFSMKNSVNGTNKISNVSATITSPTTGDVTYYWAVTDTATAGLYNIEFKVTLASGGIFKVPTNSKAQVNIESAF